MARREEELKARAHPIFFAYKCCCLSYLILLYLTFGTLLILNPLFYIDSFYVPALDKFSNSTAADGIIFFNLTIQNQMDDVGVRYGAVNLTFSYGANTSNMTIGTYTVAGFYQGMDKTAQRRGAVVVNSSAPWKEAAMRALAGGLKTEFRVDLVTDVQLKNTLWYFKEKRITAGGSVEVDRLGKKVAEQAVPLQPGEPDPSALITFLWIAGYLLLTVFGMVLIIVALLYFCSFFYP